MSRKRTGKRLQEIFDVGIGERLPQKADIIDILGEIQKIVFSGFFGKENSAYVRLENFAGSTLAIVYEKLFKQIRTTLLFRGKQNRGEQFDNEVEELTLKFIDRLPDIPYIPRIMTEYAHGKTGIYQGVTLGALSTMKGQQLSGIKRHPTIEDHVVIYANATVLGYQ